MGIILKSQSELDKMREAGLIVSAVLDAVEVACVPGVTTFELNRIAERELERAKARSAFLGYRPGGAPPYPAVLCTSVNRVVVHGSPSKHGCLRAGDREQEGGPRRGHSDGDLFCLPQGRLLR